MLLDPLTILELNWFSRGFGVSNRENWLKCLWGQLVEQKSRSNSLEGTEEVQAID